ncbi:DUF3822 family protein [Nonlabens xiamenensis]|uniref:DUF3822 family protein n=1 Tax=Nonlabens xiamenensis TaxID=2341043 RepID=UPI000F60BC6C|nr:DUF3822 family protein [Nonlabens xiamenensis]
MPKTKDTPILKKLSVLIHQDGLSFYAYQDGQILDAYHERFKHPANPIELLKRIEEIYQQQEFLDYAFAKATLFYHHNIFTCVPGEIFNEKQAVDYLKYNARILETDHISTDELSGELNIHTVYIAYANINNYFFERYGSFDYYHYGSRLLELRSQDAKSLHFDVSLEVMVSDFYLSIFKNGKLHAHNLFPFEAIEDILYYTMYTTHHCEADPETFKLRIISENHDQELYDLLYTYVRHVEYQQDYPTYKNQFLCV